MTPSLSELPPFPGLRDEGLHFLEALKQDENQNRDWFNKRKHLYTDELRWPLRCLVSDVIRRLERHPRVRLYGEPTKSVFRIYRDTRFSKDKSPYKRHVACRLTVDPSLDDGDGLLYVHIEAPDTYFVAAGIYAPPVKRLRPIRIRIANEPFVWTDVVRQLEDGGLTPQSHGDDLSGMPRGFADYKDDDIADYLRWTSFLVTENVDESAVRSPDFAEHVASFADRAWPLLAFIRETR